MLHAMVARKLRRVFEALNRGDTQPMLDALAPRFVYRFEGDSAIGGVRRSRESMQRWWARMFRLFPGLQFELRTLHVSGWPWRMRVHSVLEFSVPHEGPQRYRNVVMQHMELHWDRVVSVHTLEDTQRCARYLAWRAQAVPEAQAPAITDAAWPEAGPFMSSAPATAGA
jgi:ketosteroid isomerase-like protein